MTEQDLIDSILRQAIELQRLSAGDEARAEAILVELEDELRALLGRRDLSAATRKQIGALIAEAENAIAGKYVNIAGVVDVEAIVQHVADETVRFMDETFPTAISNPTIETLRSLSRDILIEGSPASAWWKRQAEDTAFKFAGIVRRGVLNGATNEAIVREVAGKNGLFDFARRNVRTLVHSSIMTAANRARLETYRKNFSDTAAGVKWLATLDSHTCFTCATLDGAQWDFDGKPINGTKKTFTTPPAHMNCRCIVSPIPKYDALEELFPGIGAKLNAAGERASSSGPVKSGTTFEQFLSRQPDAWVDEYLGKRRAELYQAGKITLTDLVTKGGREKTLDEIAR